MAVLDKGRIFLVTRVPISAGSELLWDYGTRYPWARGERKCSSGALRGVPECVDVIEKLVKGALEGGGEEVGESPRDNPPGGARLEEEKSTFGFREGQFMVIWDKKDKRCHVAKVITLDSLGQFLEIQIYGSYSKGSGIHSRKWAPAYVDPRDGKLVFTNKPHNRFTPWTWKVEKHLIKSVPFQLRAGRVPAGLRVRSGGG
jgi:hypothetical protein